MDAQQRLDFIIFGASGFTGRWAVREAEKLADEKNLTWGIAGRNHSKLKHVLAQMAKETGNDLSNTKIILADITDEQSLYEMAQIARVIVNCCGPYRQWGEPVVKACIESGTSCVDISGENEFIEEMQLKYSEKAEKAGVYIISACGVDSIPADLGAVYLQENFNGEVNSIESYIKLWTNGSFEGPAFNYGTWESAICAVAEMNSITILQQILFQKPPVTGPMLKWRQTIFWSKITQGWCLPCPVTDLLVMQRTQLFRQENEQKRPAQMTYYFSLPTFLSCLLVLLSTCILSLLSKLTFGRKLLLAYPGFFSLGLVGRGGISEEKLLNTNFEVTLVGRGWKKTNEEPAAVYSTEPDQKMTVKVSGTNPGYGATAKSLLLAGITILKESHKMPKRGGVLPPGAAFANTSLVKELHSHGVKFEILPPEPSL